MIHQKTRSGDFESAAYYFLWPGERFCNWLDVRDQDSRMLLRMFVNLTVYGKVALSVVLICSAID